VGIVSLNKSLGLPTFRHPPVTEVVLSIQFAACPSLRSVHAGLYWEKIRSDYPRVSEQVAIAPVFETFGGRPPSTPSFQVQTLLAPPMPRHWFESETGEHLVQLQPDRILHNWRQQASLEYPRFEAIRPKFAAEVAELEAFFGEEKIGIIQPNQCEVTYINTIALPDGANPHENLKVITPLWSGDSSDRYLPELETATIRTAYVLKRNGAPYGRVYVNFVPAFRVADASPVVQLEITARGRPAADTVPAAFDLLNEEHEVVVRTFAAVTSPTMHKQWGRADVDK
jgi:uncharacterized protein (TIGR04255 family)